MIPRSVHPFLAMLGFVLASVLAPAALRLGVGWRPESPYGGPGSSVNFETYTRDLGGNPTQVRHRQNAIGAFCNSGAWLEPFK